MARWKVPIYAQSTLALCWEACGRMMWHWRHNSLNGYSPKAASYLNIRTGLAQVQLNGFYTTLGLRPLRNARGKNLRHALQWTPVVFTSTSKVSGHAMVAIEFYKNQYRVINPCAVEVVSFGDGSDSCQGGTVLLTKQGVEGSLGPFIWYW
jgi:Papain-like cysteine protease AvrRpt2